MLARATAMAAGALARCGLHDVVLPKMRVGGGVVGGRGVAGVEPGTCGVMLGSPEHRVRRAIACYRSAGGWEVAKAAFGEAGWEVIRGETEALESLPAGTRGAPKLLGVHRGEDLALLRMPYIDGVMIGAAEVSEVLSLLESWRSELPAMPIHEFGEWPVIEAALAGDERGRSAMEDLSNKMLRPVIRHGDLARWNLLRTAAGGLMVLDWEWGVARGMPGLDLAHFFAQDARLVRRLPPREVIRSVLGSLQHPACLNYLASCGWQDDCRSVMLASIAFTVGAKQQANEEILAAMLARVGKSKV